MKRPTIEELERILSSKEDLAIELLPNGEIRAKKMKKKLKVLTQNKQLGEYY